jgi:hypothetical protein
MLKETYWLKTKKPFQLLKSIGLLFIPAALYIIPIEWVENQHSICIYKNLTGNECYGCGMTRAILYAMHFQFEKAFQYNKLFVIVLPLLIYIWIKTVIKLWPERLKS